MSEEGMSLIMFDKIDWETLLGPQYILGKYKQLIPVYIGSTIITGEFEDNIVGIYVKTKFYNKIDHKKIYIFFNEIGKIEKEVLNYAIDLLNDEKNYVDNEISMNRGHYHIGVECKDYDYTNAKMSEEDDKYIDIKIK